MTVRHDISKSDINDVVPMNKTGFVDHMTKKEGETPEEAEKLWEADAGMAVC